MYLPFQFASVLAKKEVLSDPDSTYGYSAIGRLKSGVTITQADTELAQLRNGLFATTIPPRYQHEEYVEKAYLTAGSARTGLPTYVGPHLR